MNPQLLHWVTLRPASKASSPKGKKIIETTIVHTGKPAR